MELGALEDHHEKESNPSHNMDPHLSPTRSREPERPRTMKDYALPIIGTQPSAILLDQASRNYELKIFHFNMLPSYYGRQDEDALQFMKEYCFVLGTFPLAQLTEDQLRMRLFPYCLKEKAKQWLRILPSGSLTTWDMVCKRFFTRFFPAEKAREIRIRIVEFSEEDGEPFHEAWERYKLLLGQPSAILFDQASRNYKLKSFHFNMLPSYYGHQDEDALQFMKEYCFVLEAFPLAQLTEDQLRMRCFPYCLKEKAKQWLMTLPSGTLTTWDGVYRKFFTKFFPAEKAREIRIRIAEFLEEDGEPFHEAWERYKSLLGQCPYHMYTEEYEALLFYDGLSSFTQTIVDNACGGAMRESTAREVLRVYEMLSQNSQHWNSSDRRMSRNKCISNEELTLQLASLTKQVQSIITNLGKQAGANQVWGGEDYGMLVGQYREEEAQAINPYHQWSNNNISR